MNSIKKYDLIVIGSGSGARLAEALAARGFHVALVEKAKMGGTCLNRGCIPSKMLIHSAETALEVQEAYLQNIEITKWSCDFSSLVKRVCKVVDETSNDMLQSHKKIPNLDLYSGPAEFVSSHEVCIENQKITAEKIFLAVGARPYIPEIPGLLGTPFITSEQALRLTKKPQHVVILGGGDIAAEFGFYFSALGSEVTLLVRSDTMLSREDVDVQKVFRQEFTKTCQVLLQVEILRVSYKEKTFSIHYREKDSSRAKCLNADVFLIAAGVTPNTDTLKLKNTRVKKDEKGFILVNSHLQTKEKHIWAFGDCTGPPFFRHSANFEVDYLLNTLFTKKRQKSINYNFIPHAIFSNPQVAAIGKTEQELKKKGTLFVAGFCNYNDVARGRALRSDGGFVKLLFDKKTKVLLGAHVLGKEAATLCHILIAFLQRKSKAEDIRDMVYIHPTLPEVIKEAAKRSLLK